MKVKTDPTWVKILFWIAAIGTVLVFLVHFQLVGFGVYSDGLGYFAPLRSFFFDGNLEVSDEYRFYSESASAFGGGIRFSGPIPTYSLHTIGMPMVLAPFFGVGHLAAAVVNAAGVAVELNGLTWPYELFYCLGSLGLGILGLALCYKAASRRYGIVPTVLAVAAIWFASPLTYYLAIEVSMSHAVSQFLVSLFLYLCLTVAWQTKAGWRLLVGFVLGMATLVRPQNALFGLVPAVMLVFPGKAEVLSWPRRAAVMVAVAFAALAALIPQFMVYNALYDHPFYFPYLHVGTPGGSAALSASNMAIVPVLFSGFHGLFAWHPILLLAVVGLLWEARKLPGICIALIGVFVLQVLLIASWHCWWQGASFGGRMFSSCSFAFVFGLAALWSQLKGRRGRVVAATVTAFFILWNGLLLLQFKSAMIPAEEPVSLREIAANQVKVVPYFMRHVTGR